MWMVAKRRAQFPLWSNLKSYLDGEKFIKFLVDFAEKYWYFGKKNELN